MRIVRHTVSAPAAKTAAEISLAVTSVTPVTWLSGTASRSWFSMDGLASPRLCEDIRDGITEADDVVQCYHSILSSTKWVVEELLAQLSPPVKLTLPAATRAPARDVAQPG